MNLVHQVLYLSLETWSFLIQAFSWQITCQCSPSIELKRSFVGRDFVRHCMEEPGAAAPLNITTLLLLSRGCRLCLSILWLHHSFILIHFWGRFETVCSVCTLHIGKVTILKVVETRAQILEYQLFQMRKLLSDYQRLLEYFCKSCRLHFFCEMEMKQLATLPFILLSGLSSVWGWMGPLFGRSAY